MSLILQDSNFQDGITKRYHEQCAAYMNTVDQLQQKIVDGQLEIVNLQTYNPRSEIESPVWYEIKSYGEKRGYKVVNECHFYSSHYIGRYSHDGYAIIINPRFGNIFNYLVSYATNIYIPYGQSEISFNTQNNSYWLIGRRGNSPWIAPAPLTKYLSTTEHEERQVTDSMHLCSQPLYL